MFNRLARSGVSGVRSVRSLSTTGMRLAAGSEKAPAAATKIGEISQKQKDKYTAFVKTQQAHFNQLGDKLKQMRGTLSPEQKTAIESELKEKKEALDKLLTQYKTAFEETSSGVSAKGQQAFHELEDAFEKNRAVQLAQAKGGEAASQFNGAEEKFYESYQSGFESKSRKNPTYEDLPNPRDLPRPATEVLHRPIVNPADKYTEQVEELHKFGRYLMGCLPKFIQEFSVWKDELTVYVAPSATTKVARFIRDHTPCQFKACMDVTAADYPTRTNRFDVMFDFLSVRFNSRIRIKTYASEVSPVPSLVPLFPGNNWFERETYDMYGIFFEGHPDLRRILTDYGFEGYPLRKDFPTTGYTEVRYDPEKRRVVYEPIEMAQAWRNFAVGSSVWDQVGDGVDSTPTDFKLPEPVIEEEPKDEKKK